MKKKTSFSTKGQRADIGDLPIYRILPNPYANAVGPFVFLDHIISKLHPDVMNSGTGAHPHRGIATLSYIIEGEDEHFDNAGNYAKVYSGGIQWMKAGNGIIHDEALNVDPRTGTNRIHAFQFWINLPSKNKTDKPAYLAIQSKDVPEKQLPNDGGWIKIILGDFEGLHSKIPDYSRQFLYHIKVEPGKNFIIFMDQKIEVAGFLPTKNTTLNDVEFKAGEFIEFDRNAGEIVIENKLQGATDILLFGGEPYLESIVAQGPFVMNTEEEVKQAFKDFREGRFGNRPEKQIHKLMN